MNTVRGCSVSNIRNRAAVLRMVVPKILGILCTRGQKLHDFGGRSVRLTETVVLSAHPIDAHRLMIGVYDGPVWEIVKVLSLHVTDFPDAADPSFYRYQGGRVAVLSWRRGKWEDAVMADETAPISISEAFRQGPRLVEIRDRPRPSSRSEHPGRSSFTE